MYDREIMIVVRDNEEETIENGEEKEFVHIDWLPAQVDARAIVALLEKAADQLRARGPFRSDTWRVRDSEMGLYISGSFNKAKSAIYWLTKAEVNDGSYSIDQFNEVGYIIEKLEVIKIGADIRILV